MTAERRVGNGDVEIAYWVHGDGAPLTLLMGLATTAAAWGPLPGLLGSQGFKVIVIENRDTGLSSPSPSGYTIADMAGDVAAVLDQEGVSRTGVLGISMGGFIAQELALTHPSRVSDLMLISSGPGIGGGVAPEPEIMVELFGLTMIDDPSARLRRTIELLSGPGFAAANPGVVDAAVAIGALGAGADYEALARQWTAIAAFSSWERLDRIDVPTLILHGDKDPLVPLGNGQNLASRIAGSQLVVLEGAGHLLPLERPVETAGYIFEFFAESREGAA